MPDEPGEVNPIVELPPEYDEDASLPLLGVRETTELRRRSLALGVEALAWYMPFHQSVNQWGCYLSVSGICAFADLFLPLALPATRRIQLAVNLLLRHELTHFSVEYAVAQWELSMFAASYWPGKKALRDDKLGFIECEEKAANAYMLRGLRFPSGIMRVPGALDILRDYTASMPRGYSDGRNWLDRSRFEILLQDLAGDYACSMQPRQSRSRDALDRLGFYPNRGKPDPRQVPIFIVSDVAGVQIPHLVLRIIPSIPAIRESNTFIKMLNKQTDPTRRAWSETRTKLARSTGLPGLDFKPWRRGGANVFSVRVTGSVRAHVRHHPQENAWEAIDIGSHDQMGH